MNRTHTHTHTHRTTKKGYEEVHVPALKPPAMKDGEALRAHSASFNTAVAAPAPASLRHRSYYTSLAIHDLACCGAGGGHVG